MKSWSRGADWINFVIGLWLAAAPWALGFADDGAAATTTAAVGWTVAVVSLWALGVPSSRGAQWSNVLLGLGLAIAPWTLGFADLTGATWNAVISGLAVAGIAGAVLPSLTRPPAGHTSGVHDDMPTRERL